MANKLQPDEKIFLADLERLCKIHMVGLSIDVDIDEPLKSCIRLCTLGDDIDLSEVMDEIKPGLQ
jgi:hypothetical protein